MSQAYSYKEAFDASLVYFNGNELSAKTFLNKYALKDNDLNLLEKTPKDMHKRIAKEFARIEKKKFKNPLTEEQIFALLDNFSKIIPQGSPMFGIGNNYQIISLSNCFVVESPLDSYAAILKSDEELAQISKRRGGNGLDIENIRPAGAITHNAARTATGTIPFCSRFSNTIREVGQNGRRGALMLTQNIHHPESVIPWDEKEDGKEFFTHIKDKDLGEFDISSRYFNPNKLDFATMKYDKTKVTGANVSLRLTDEFLNAVDKKEKYEQRWPTDPKKAIIRKAVDAVSVWNKIIYSAWRTAEPGVLFWDNIIKESIADCYSEFGFKTICVNPCGEITLSAYDSCRLLVVNLFSFVRNPFTKDAYFDYEDFYKTGQIAQRLMDDLIDLEEECINKIIQKIESDPESSEIKYREINLWKKILKACQDGRRTGTGITALGDTIAALGIGYGTEEGISTTEKIYKTLKFAAYRASVDMAKELGTFPIWNHELEKNNPFIKRISEESITLNPSNLIINGKDIWNDMKQYGRRNIALLTTAPTGTVSIVARLNKHFGTSSGIEPQYDITPYTRKVKGNPGDTNFKSDSVDQNGDHWQHYEVRCSGLQEYVDVTGEKDYQKSPWWNHCAAQLDWKLRVRLQAAAQKHVDHSISSTVNLPNDVTVEKVDEIYRTAWKSGCKGITIYRDGCRTGVLVKEEPKPIQKDEIQKTTAPKRPSSLPCDVHHIKVKGTSYFVLVGLLGKDPYEVFAGKNGVVKKEVTKGNIDKKGNGRYDAVFEDGTSLTNIAKYINEDEEALTRLTSTCLRHGANVEFIVNQLEKTDGNLTSFSKAMARALKKYIDNGQEIKGEICPQDNCGGKIIRQDGCLTCQSCGFSKCS